MKKQLLIFIAIFSFLSSFSQTEKGTILIGGSISASSSNSSNSGTHNDDKNNSQGFYVSPTFDYFIKNHY